MVTFWHRVTGGSRWLLGAAGIALILALGGCQATREAIREFRVDLTQGLVELEERAAQRDAELEQKLAELEAASLEGAITPEEYLQELIRLQREDVRAQLGDLGQGWDVLKREAKDAGSQLEQALRERPRDEGGWQRVLLGMAATLLGTGGLGVRAMGLMRQEAAAYADRVAEEKAQLAAERMDMERDRRRAARHEPVAQAPSYVSAPMVPVPQAAPHAPVAQGNEG